MSNKLAEANEQAQRGFLLLEYSFLKALNVSSHCQEKRLLLHCLIDENSEKRLDVLHRGSSAAPKLEACAATMLANVRKFVDRPVSQEDGAHQESRYSQKSRASPTAGSVVSAGIALKGSRRKPPVGW